MPDAPAKNPCGSCPYRQDVPSGIWHETMYEKLPGFDKPLTEQAPRVFGCHQDNGKLCSGWVGCHDMAQTLGFRIAVSDGHISEEDALKCLEYESPVPLFASGAEAAEHGMRDIDNPGPRAQRMVEKLLRTVKGVGY